MSPRSGSLFVLLFVLITNSTLVRAADDDRSLRLPRLKSPSTDHTLKDSSLSASKAASVIFPGKRTKTNLDQFDQWKRGYAHPSICGMVLCGGSCQQFDDACPAFDGLSVLDVEQPGLLLTERKCGMNSSCASSAEIGCQKNCCRADESESAQPRLK